MQTYAAIRAISTYLPKTVEKNEFPEAKLEKIGIYERRISSDNETAGDLAVKAAENLFNEYNINKDDIDYLVVCLMHPDYPMPPTACIAQDRLGLSKNIGAIDISMGCSGYVYGLSLVKGLIESGLVKNVLYLTSNVMTKFINKKDNNMRPLFGDAGTASLITAVESDAPFLHSFVFGTDGSGFDVVGVPAGGSKYTVLNTEKITEEDERGNIRTNFEWHMNGSEIFAFMLNTVPKLVEEVLKKANLTREDIDYYIFHQANRYMLKNVQKKCHLEEMAFYNDMSKVGNTSSCSIPLCLAALSDKIELTKLHRTMLAGFGVGLSWAGCIADLSQMLEKN